MITANIIYEDIKLDNIVVDSNDKLRIIDFAFCSDIQDDKVAKYNEDGDII